MPTGHGAFIGTFAGFGLAALGSAVPRQHPWVGLTAAAVSAMCCRTDRLKEAMLAGALTGGACFAEHFGLPGLVTATVGSACAGGWMGSRLVG